jgi:hypothetical protein
MNRTHVMPVIDDRAEVEAFALGELWTAFTKGIEAGRNKEILNERADAWVANSTAYLKSTRPPQ